MAAHEVLLIADHDGCHFEIEEGSGEGFYVWRFVGDETLATHDHLQDNLADAKSFALDQWGVPENAWRPQVTSAESRLRPSCGPPRG
jgi:hypothetical protein